jgi:hypothetical protein
VVRSFVNVVTPDADLSLGRANLAIWRRDRGAQCGLADFEGPRLALPLSLFLIDTYDTSPDFIY